LSIDELGDWRRSLKVRYALSVHDVLDCPPSLRFGEVQWASWMKAIIRICALHLGHSRGSISYVILREDLHYVIVRDELLLVELSEDTFSECILDSFKVYFLEPGEDAVLPVPVGEESV
jgi:hypothetical protein